MKQSKLMSWLETSLSTAIGFGISLLAQMIFLPMLGVAVTHTQNFYFALIMTVVSLVRGFCLRRVFEALHIRRPLSSFAQAAIAERIRQIEGEGWDATHDDNHDAGDMSLAGAAYARLAHLHLEDSAGFKRDRLMLIPKFWPWTFDWYKPDGFRRDLVKACALIIAEGEKFDRRRGKSRKAV